MQYNAMVSILYRGWAVVVRRKNNGSIQMLKTILKIQILLHGWAVVVRRKNMVSMVKTIRLKE